MHNRRSLLLIFSIVSQLNEFIGNEQCVEKYLDKYNAKCDNFLEGPIDDCIVVFEFNKLLLGFSCNEIKREGISKKGCKKVLYKYKYSN